MDKNNTWIKLKRFFRHHECSESCQCESRENWRDSEKHSFRLWRHNASVTKSGWFQDMTKGIWFSYRFHYYNFTEEKFIRNLDAAFVILTLGVYPLHTTFVKNV